MRTSAGTAVVALVAMMLPSLPAVAAPANHLDGLEFSRDGTTWSAEPPAELFDDWLVEASGDSRSTTVHVRNARTGVVRIATAVSSLVWSHPDAAEAFRLSSSDQHGPGIVAAPIGSIARCTPLVPTRVLATGDILTIELAVDLAPDARGTAVQNASVGFDMLIALAEHPGPMPVSACSEAVHSESAVNPNSDIGIVAIASLPSALQPGTVHDTSRATSLVIPTMAVAMGAGIVGLALFVLLRLRRDAEADALGDEEPGG